VISTAYLAVTQVQCIDGIVRMLRKRRTTTQFFLNGHASIFRSCHEFYQRKDLVKKVPGWLRLSARDAGTAPGTNLVLPCLRDDLVQKLGSRNARGLVSEGVTDIGILSSLVAQDDTS